MTGTGFRITPVLGLLAAGFVPVPAAAEVEEVFELPLSVLLDPAAPQKRRAEFEGGSASSGCGRMPSITSGARPPRSWCIWRTACAPEA